MSLLGSLDPFVISTARLHPLPCDRWIARSCLQKAIRRGDANIAIRALANLFLHDPKAIWRHLTIMALEDVGVANIGALQRIVTAKAEHTTRRAPGLLWATFVNLTEELALSEHSQAICDLLIRLQNDPSGTQNRDCLIEAGPSRWAETLYDTSASLAEKAAAGLCFGGFMGSSLPGDPSAVFEIYAETTDRFWLADLARSAWKLSRNPMALLLPVVEQNSRNWTAREIRDDRMGPAASIGGIPEYAFDQFTRIGKSALRAMVGHDYRLQQILTAAGVGESDWAQVAGDLVFLIEGGLCVRRATWAQAETLRVPSRWLPSTALLGPALQPALKHLASNRRQLTSWRQQLYQRAQ